MLSSSLITINVAIEIFSSVLCLVFLICVFIAHGIKDKLNRIFAGVLLSNVAVMLSDALAFSSIGKPGTLFLVLNYIGNICTYLFSYILIMFFSNYIITYLSTKIKVNQAAVYIVYGICGFALLLTFVALYNGMYFYIDENNIYHRREMYWFSQVLGIVGLLMNIGIILSNRKNFNRVETFVLASYIVMPVIAITIQMLIYGFVSVYIASTITILIMYIGLQGELSKRLKQKELELINSRIDIMLSQIQPHFLYNSLTAISGLCGTDPERAEEALNDFAHYLRKNIDSLGSNCLISFENELEHLNHYLKLEKMRFGDRIKVDYNIGIKNFDIPPLIVQPLAENAVRYGITKKLGGGTLTIATMETKNSIVITISDDGLGFSGNAVSDKTRRHIGVENVRTRLKSQLDGTLTIESKVDEGTVCTITIPKQKTETPAGSFKQKGVAT